MSVEGFDNITLEYGEEHFREGEKVGNGEISVESDKETMPFSTSNKRVKEMPIDRLSELPDSLLVHILSFLGVEKAGITSVLSKRWKCLWAELPRLEFVEKWGIVRKPSFVSWVNRTLDTRKAGYLEKFLVEFFYYKDCFASEVDAWVEFSVKNKVKEFNLVNPGPVDYTLPQVMYSCSSLTDLHLRKCIMSPERKIEWQSLTRLSLDIVELDQALIDEILSSCSVLKSLELEGCWGFTRLKVNSRCLNYLRLRESDKGSYMEISAPYVSNLNIIVFPKGGNWQLKNISSVIDANIDFYVCYGGFPEVMSNANEFLKNFKQVKKLYIARTCFEVLSIMAINGWRFPQFKLQNLTLLSLSHFEQSISGIIAMLESSPNLETLLLKGYQLHGVTFELDPTTKGDLDGDLLHLKTIRVNDFADSNGEPLLTLASILLKRAPVLEEMIIGINVKDTSDYVNIAEKLLTYPRSSTKAKLHLRSCK